MNKRVETEFGLIPIDWKIVKFEDVAELRHGYQFRNYDFTEEGIKIVKITQIKGEGQVDISNCSYIDKSRLDNFKKFIIDKGDILLALTGATIGKFARYEEEETVLQNYRVGNFFPLDYDVLSKDYLYYYLSSNYFFHQILARQTQSAQQNIGKDEINNMSIILPSINEQKEIANTLSNLDKKITLLCQQNKDLEELAQSLFKRWFVEFEFTNENGEPYKSSSGEMVGSELGEIPEGWRIMPLSDIAIYLNGLACQKYSVVDNQKKLPVLKIKELGNGISENSDWATSDVDSKYIIKNGDVIFSWSGTLMLKIWDGEDCVLNQHLFKVTSDEFPKWFIYQWTGLHLRHFIAVAQSKATTMGHIKRSHLDEALCIIPSIEVLNKFNPSFNAQLELYINNNKEIQTLTQLRDTLLPKLISGELRVNNHQI